MVVITALKIMVTQMLQTPNAIIKMRSTKTVVIVADMRRCCSEIADSLVGNSRFDKGALSTPLH
jgi:hypothetical protein